ncbi:MAG: aminopeptidase [Erysipelotrichaceae bacterium]|nr:aminopeptidase [Erysipelotrichaceae bacterium]
MINIDKGVSIILHDWLNVRKDELIHFITDEKHLKEAEAIGRWADGADAVLKTTVLPSHVIQDGEVIEKMVGILSNENVIIGATNYSFITTNAIKTAVSNGARFLSIPLSCTDGTSLLENDFILMNTNEAKRNARKLISYINGAERIRVTTKLGTDLSLSIKGRKPGSFYGQARRSKETASASFEVYVAPMEDSMNGVLYLDASIGYVGLVKNPIRIVYKDGTMISAESEGDDAEKLLNYIDSFHDRTMYKPGEFGIGLNKRSRVRGVCYIEDESTYSTFHIGMGRNIALGGVQEAAGHFDIVTNRPNIYIDDMLIMKEGEIFI